MFTGSEQLLREAKGYRASRLNIARVGKGTRASPVPTDSRHRSPAPQTKHGECVPPADNDREVGWGVKSAVGMKGRGGGHGEASMRERRHHLFEQVTRRPAAHTGQQAEHELTGTLINGQVSVGTQWQHGGSARSIAEDSGWDRSVTSDHGHRAKKRPKTVGNSWNCVQCGHLQAHCISCCSPHCRGQANACLYKAKESNAGGISSQC